MSILRKHSKENYTIIHNDILSDENLSYRARGLAVFLLSKPDDWIVRIEHLAQNGNEGQNAIRKALKELATAGYLKRTRERGEGGSLFTKTHLADYPAFLSEGTPQARINGYEPVKSEDPDPTPQEPDLPETDRSVNRTSAAQTSDSCKVIISTDLPSTDLPSTEEQESASADADTPAPDPDDSFEAIYGKGTAGFDGPLPEAPRLPLNEEWDKPLCEMEPHRAMFVAVLDAIGWDRQTLAEGDRAQVAQACRILREADYEYTDVGDFMKRIWFNDWRWTQNHSRPTLNQLRKEIGKLRAVAPDEPVRKTQGGQAVSTFFDRLDRQGIEVYQ